MPVLSVSKFESVRGLTTIPQTHNYKSWLIFPRILSENSQDWFRSSSSQSTSNFSLMAPNKNTGLILVLVVAMLWSRAAAQSSDCTDALLSLSSCINYITGNTSTPSSRCCSHLADIVSSKPHCLCEALSMDTSSLGINVNQTQVVALPGACNIQTPPLSACGADSPAGAPESPNTTPTGSRFNTVPSTQSDGASAASSSTLSVSLLLVLFLASFSMH